jgi:hypothetical protein
LNGRAVERTAIVEERSSAERTQPEHSRPGAGD